MKVTISGYNSISIENESSELDISVNDGHFYVELFNDGNDHIGYISLDFNTAEKLINWLSNKLESQRRSME